MVHTLCRTTIDGDFYGATLVISGRVEFDKPPIVNTLCHHSDVRKTFTNGFIFIKLGLDVNATDLNNIFHELYHSLTNRKCNPAVIKKNIKTYTRDHCYNLLFIISDVWEIKHAEPLLEALSNCKTVITTSMKAEVEHNIPSQHLFSIGSDDVQGCSIVF